ncbi:MAG TPA: response regulator [Mucilaginibacter sp.]|nr:response regulator [Mucilaginibacter sp.]
MKNTCIAITEGWNIYLEGIALLLERYGYDVVAKAHDITELQEQLNSCKCLPDTCIINIACLVGEDSIFQKLRMRYPQIRIVAYSSNEDAPSMEEAMVKGIDQYLLKVDRIEDALKAISTEHGAYAFNK